MNKSIMPIAINELEMVNGGMIAQNSNGSCDTDDKYLVVDDNTHEVICKTGGYRHARKLAKALNLSVDMIPFDQIVAH